MKRAGMYLQAVFYAVAGVNHFRHPEFYMPIVPHWLPKHSFIILISGVCEILFGLLLLVPATRKLGAWLLILLLIAVFPANIQMTIDYAKAHNPHTWLTFLRLPLQFLLIWWAFIYTRNLTPASKVDEGRRL